MDKDIIEGLQILCKNRLEDFSIYCAHDEIYAGPSFANTSLEDDKRLKELDWFVKSCKKHFNEEEGESNAQKDCEECNENRYMHFV